MDKVHPEHVTVPSPLSVAKVAQEPPVDEISTLEASIFPPYVACNPLPEDSAVDSIFVSEIETVPPLVAHKAFAPFAFVVIVPPVIVNPPPLTKTAAFTP